MNRTAHGDELFFFALLHAPVASTTGGARAPGRMWIDFSRAFSFFSFLPWIFWFLSLIITITITQSLLSYSIHTPKIDPLVTKKKVIRSSSSNDSFLEVQYIKKSTIVVKWEYVYPVHYDFTYIVY